MTMATIDDMASEREQQELERARAFRKPVGPDPTGHCLYCGAPLAEGLRWCDVDCRDDWERVRAK